MLVTRKRLTEAEEQARLLEVANNGQKKEIERLVDELALETSWAEGEIEFWQEQCDKAEKDADHQQRMKEYYLHQICILEDELDQLKNRKPWYRYVIS